MLRLRGTPFEVGQQHGVVLGPRLRAGIDRYLATLERNHGLDHDRLQAEAMGALAGLPPRFREESLGLADGAGLTVEEVARWQHADACRCGCTAVLWQVAGDWWVARNNDVDPIDGLWGHVVVREVRGRLPAISVGLLGDVFTATGMNAASLWLHTNWLPTSDPPQPTGLLPWVFVPEALETCRTVVEVEALLGEQQRRHGMILAAVDVAGDAALLDCDRTSHRRRPFRHRGGAATNHAVTPVAGAEPAAASCARLARVESRLAAAPPTGPADLQRLLADPQVAQDRPDHATVFATVACPQRRELWLAAGDTPAPSAAPWRRVPWPWLPSGGA
jgi:hypothetical protein